MLRDQSIPIGGVARPHGIKGAILLRLESSREHLLNLKEPILLQLHGALVPFFLEEITPNGDSVIVKPELIASEQDARKLQGARVFILKKESRKKSPAPKIPFENYRFTDQNSGISGTVKSYLDDSANPLFEVIANQKSFMVPAHKDFIKKVSDKKCEIIFNLPSGIFLIDS